MEEVEHRSRYTYQVLFVGKYQDDTVEHKRVVYDCLQVIHRSIQSLFGITCCVCVCVLICKFLGLSPEILALLSQFSRGPDYQQHISA